MGSSHQASKALSVDDIESAYLSVNFGTIVFFWVLPLVNLFVSFVQDIAKDDHYGYVAQELCDYTLDEYLHLLVKKKGLNPAVDVSVLFRLVYQFFRGLQVCDLI